MTSSTISKNGISPLIFSMDKPNFTSVRARFPSLNIWDKEKMLSPRLRNVRYLIQWSHSIKVTFALSWAIRRQHRRMLISRKRKKMWVDPLVVARELSLLKTREESFQDQWTIKMSRRPSRSLTNINHSLAMESRKPTPCPCQTTTVKLSLTRWAKKTSRHRRWIQIWERGSELTELRRKQWVLQLLTQRKSFSQLLKIPIKPIGKNSSSYKRLRTSDKQKKN